MKILDKHEFLKLPSGALFAAYYSDGTVGKLAINDEPALILGTSFGNSAVLDNLMDYYKKHGKYLDVPMLQRTKNDIGKRSNYCLVWTKDDIDGLIEKLILARLVFKDGENYDYTLRERR